jgi:hypothetical protein
MPALRQGPQWSICGARLREAGEGRSTGADLLGPPGGPCDPRAIAPPPAAAVLRRRGRATPAAAGRRAPARPRAAARCAAWPPRPRSDAGRHSADRRAPGSSRLDVTPPASPASTPRSLPEMQRAPRAGSHAVPRGARVRPPATGEGRVGRAARGGALAGHVDLEPAVRLHSEESKPGVRAKSAEGRRMTVTDDAASSFEVPPPAPELRRLEPLIGKWHTQTHTEDSVLGPGVPVTSTERVLLA